jgi:hypothetical protein
LATFNGNVTQSGAGTVTTGTGLFTAGGNASITGTLGVTGVTTLTGNLLSNGNTTLGDASGDTLTLNGATWTIPNATTSTVASTLNFDSNTLQIDGTNNRVGVGLAAPSTAFSALGNNAAGAVASFTNNNATASSAVQTVRIGVGNNAGCSSAGTCPRFLNFYKNVTAGDSGGTAVGHIRISNAGTGITTTSGSADFAEYMIVSTASSDGDIIGFGGGVKRLAQSGDVILGSVSNNSAFVGNGNLESVPNAAIVGLIGVVPAKVNTSNGNISVGDPITVSASSGIGMKQTSSGYTLGYALADYTAGGTGSIDVFVAPKYTDVAALSGGGGGGEGDSGYWSRTGTVISTATASDSLVLDGALTLNNNITQTGAMTLTTGTGAVSLNGATTIASAQSLASAGGAANFDWSASSGSFQTSTGTNTLNGNTVISGSGTFSTGAGLTTIGGNLTQSGAGTLTTGTGLFTASGAATIAGLATFNGNITQSSTNTLTTGTGLFTASGAATIAGTLTGNGQFVLGDNGDTGAINTSDWDISTTGVMTGISGITTNGGYTQSGTSVNTFTGNISQTGTTTFSTGTGAISLNGTTTIATGQNFILTNGDITVNTNKFTVAGSTGNTLVAGTFNSQGAGDFDTTLNVDGNTTLVGDVSMQGNTTLGNAGADTITFVGVVASPIVFNQTAGLSPIVFEGAVANAFTTTLAMVEPTASRVATLPDLSGTVLLSGNDSIDWSDISDSSTLDASTSIGFGAGAFDLAFVNNGTGNEVHNLSSTGDVVFQDNGVAFLTLGDDDSLVYTTDLATTNAWRLTGNSLTTGNLFGLTANGLTDGDALSIASSATGLTTSGYLFNTTATGTPGASWTGQLAAIEYTTSTSANIDGSALKVGITGAGAGSGVALNLTSAQTGAGSYVFRSNDDGTYADSSPIVMTTDGRLGISQLTPSTLLHVGDVSIASTNVITTRDSNGTCVHNPTTTGTGWSCSSDERLKSNVESLDDENMLDTLLKIQPRSFILNTDGELYQGFIAQEVQKIIPSAVSVIEPETGMLGINESKFTPYIIGSIREHHVLLGGELLKEVSDIDSIISQDGRGSAENTLGNRIAEGLDVIKTLYTGTVVALQARIDEVFAQKVHTQELCLTDDSGEELCVTKNQLQQLLSGSAANSTTSSGSGNGSSTGGERSAEQQTVPVDTLLESGALAGETQVEAAQDSIGVVDNESESPVVEEVVPASELTPIITDSNNGGEVVSASDVVVPPPQE